MCRFIENSGMNKNYPENSENGAKMRHSATHSHTSNLQGCGRLHGGTANSDNNKSESTDTRKRAKQARTIPGR